MGKLTLRVLAGGIALIGWSSCAASGFAQYRPGFGAGPLRPTVSPYLNLAQRGDAAVNYYGLVRPQLAYNKAIQNINNDINYLETNPNLPVQTGHPSSFMTQGKFFMNNGYAGAGNQLGYRPGTVAGSNTIVGGNQSGVMGPGFAGGMGVPPTGSSRVR